jgi:uncharacterized protein involved in exopolysaccharide biosynthesis/Mrp family chromosome partitioning ATPase
MQHKAPPQQSASPMNIGDVYYVLFRHKGKIIGLTLAGFAAAAVLFFARATPYQSEAKLFVRYVQDSSKTISVSAPDTAVKTDSRGENIMSSEAEIITSLDLAASVVDIVGAEKILGKVSGQTNRELAAIKVKQGLSVDVPKKGNVLRVIFQHRDPEVVQPVLRAVIDTYFKKHVEIHRALGVFDELLTTQTDKLRSGLAQTEEDLRKIKAKAQVVSLEETRKSQAEQYGKLRQDLFAAQVELEERQTMLKELQKATNGNVAVVTGDSVATNDVAAVKAKIPPAELAEYKRLTGRLEAAYKRESDLLEKFTAENSLVKESRENITALENEKKEKETKNPALTAEDSTTKATPAVLKSPDGKTTDFSSETVRIAALQARIRMLENQLAGLKTEVLAVDDAEGAIVQLQRRKELEEQQYRYYSTSLEQARLDTALGAGKLSNINEIQSPSPPMRDSSKLKKMIAGAIGGGLAGGIALAFLLELVVDQSVRHSGELPTKFRLPLFLSIPEMHSKRRRLRAIKNGTGAKALKNAGPERIETGVESNGVLAQVNGNGNGAGTEIAPWDEKHELHPYSEALRDRLVTFFDTRGMTHKPKLIALTSCSAGAGVTTLAAGLAASLSETGEGNVLLVDMNFEQGAAHPFFKGKPACGLADVLDHENRDAARVQSNLYIANGSGSDEERPRILPKRFAHLLPKLQASDYDYIIFDMPPITQTSLTTRLAGFMDFVCLVVEGEKTSRDWVKHASDLLIESKVNIGAVLNKHRSYVPEWLHQGF